MSPQQKQEQSSYIRNPIALDLIYGFIAVVWLSFLVCALKYPSLDWGVQGNVISDVGAYAGTAAIFNSSLVLAGGLNLLFILGTLRTMGLRLNQPTVIVFIISAVSLSCIGFAPLPNDTDLFSLPRIIHWTFATIYFLLETLGIVLFALRIKDKYPAFSKWSLMLSLFVVLATLGNVLFVSKILSEISHTVLIIVWKLRLRGIAKSAFKEGDYLYLPSSNHANEWHIARV